jgi:YfiH family protein
VELESAAVPEDARVAALESIRGLVHGFGRRAPAGAAAAPEDTRERLRRVLEPHGRLLLLRQVHGATLHVAPWQGRPEGDAALAEQPGEILGVETADCLPVLLVDPVRRAAAVAHAGWRGTAAGVGPAALQALLRGGSRPRDVIAALGPSNGACCYEVGPELGAAFGDEWEAVTRPGPGGRPHLDVRRANQRQLERAGLAPSQIHHLPECTACLPELYHSYRREGKGGGRMISYVGWSRSA